MFIVKSGILELLSSNNTILKILKEGSTFGELSILKKTENQIYALRSIGYSEVYILRQEDALTVLKDYPQARKNLIIKGK